MTDWRTTLQNLLASLSDAELKDAMLEVQVEDLTARRVQDGVIYKIALEIAPKMQTEPVYALGLVTNAVIVAAAYRFANLTPDVKRFR